MTSPWKKAKLGAITGLLVSRLRSEAKRDSPLVLQAGFPTSVADLLVKNRSRLRKAPGWRRHPRPPADAGCSAVSASASEIDAAAPTLDQPPPTSERSGPLESFKPSIGTEVPAGSALGGLAGLKPMETEGLGDPPGSEAARCGVNPPRVHPQNAGKGESFLAYNPKAPRDETPKWPPKEASEQPPVRREAQMKDLSQGTGGRLAMVVEVAFAVVILTILSKKIAVAVSGLAFAFLFAESIWERVISLLGSCKDTQRSLDSMAAISDVTRTEAELGSKVCSAIPSLLSNVGYTDFDSFGSERDLGAEVPVNVAPPMGMAFLALEDKRHLDFDGRWGDQELVSKKKKANRKKKEKDKLLRKFVPTRFLLSKGVRGGKAEPSSEPASDSGNGDSLGWKGTSLAEALEEEGDDEKDSRGADVVEHAGRCGGWQDPAMTHKLEFGIEDESIVEAGVTEPAKLPAKENSDHLAFFAVVLCGLVGGRTVAITLTVVWYLLASFARRLWRRLNLHV